MALFIDANVPVYALGREHPLKQPSLKILEFVADFPDVFFTDSEVLQELLHRYLSLRLYERARTSVQDFAELMGDRVEPVYAADVQTAAMLVTRDTRLQARDLVHLAVMSRVAEKSIISADAGFDGVAGIERLDPANLGSWAPRFRLR